MEDVGRRVGVMLDSETTRAAAWDEAEEQSLEDLRKKYPWWLGGRAGVEASAPAQESGAEAEDTVTLFEGKSTKVWRKKKKEDEDDIIKGCVSDSVPDVVMSSL